MTLAGAALAASCKERAPSQTAAVVGAPAATRHDGAADVRVLLSLSESAYHGALAVGDDDVADLLTESAAYRLSPGRPPARRPLPLGDVAAVTRTSYVFWSAGAVREAPRSGEPARAVAAVPERPQTLVASDAGLAWLLRSPAGQFTLHASKQKAPLYTSPGTVDALAIGGDRLFFVERPGGSDWRIGCVALAGGAAAFTSVRPGRPPAMLAVNDDLAFYVGTGFEVHRLSRDLQRERTVASGFICSPLALTDTVYCAQPEGIFALPPDGPRRRLAPGDVTHPVADLAAGPRTLYWLVDAGPDRLEVRSLALRPP